MILIIFSRICSVRSSILHYNVDEMLILSKMFHLFFTTKSEVSRNLSHPGLKYSIAAPPNKISGSILLISLSVLPNFESSEFGAKNYLKDFILIIINSCPDKQFMPCIFPRSLGFLQNFQQIQSFIIPLLRSVHYQTDTDLMDK